jgi:hypothetical protein
MQWTTELPKFTLYHAQRWMKARVLGADVFEFVIELRQTGEVVGIMGSFHRPEIGYLISPGIRFFSFRKTNELLRWS